MAFSKKTPREMALEYKNRAAHERGLQLVRTLASELKEAGTKEVEAVADLRAVASAYLEAEDVTAIVAEVYRQKQ